MAASGLTLKEFYRQELEALREQGDEFGRDYPAVAQALALSRSGSRDPHVELLIQSFAFLTGRMQYQLEAEQATVPNALMSYLYPHLEAPIPAMLVAQVGVKPDGANFAIGVSIGRGRNFFATATDDSGQHIKCRFRTCYDTPLLPLEVSAIRMTPTNEYAFLAEKPGVHSVLKVRVTARGGDAIKDWQINRLRFFINSEEKRAHQLYDSLALNLQGMAIVVGDAEPRMIPADAFRWLGFADDEAALPSGAVTHPGYRIVQEYFAFPEKFLFFEVGGIDAGEAIHEFDLLFLLGSTLDKALDLTPALLRLNCVPLVNLYVQRIEPLALDQSHFEYRLTGELQNHKHCEIYAIEELVSIRPDEVPRRLAPYFAMDDYAQLEKQDYFYATRRAVSPYRSVPGTETYISFLDRQFEASRPTDEAIGGRALCTNRRLPEQLRPGDRLQLEGAGPVDLTTIITKPTPHQTPELLGAQPWALISQLALNHLSLSGDKRGLAALKSMLRLHVGQANSTGWKQIESLTELSCRPIMRHVGTEGWRGFVQGLHVHLKIDSHRFEGGSVVLFAEVLRRFFALYASLNTLTEVSLETHDTKGNLKEWPPMAGAQIVL